MVVTGEASRSTPICISRSATTRPSSSPLLINSRASRRAPKVRTSSLEAICQCKPIAPTTLLILRSAARSPIISSVSGSQLRVKSRFSPRSRPTVIRIRPWMSRTSAGMTDSDRKVGYRTEMVYDENNIFAKILRGDIPCHKIYEDEDTLVFLDIMPGTEGHAHGGGAEVSTQDQEGGRRRRGADPAIQRLGCRPDRVPSARPHRADQAGRTGQASRRTDGRSGEARRHRPEN